MKCIRLIRNFSTGRDTSAAGGSVLVPVVAAMLILLLCGVALSEAFGSQRMQAVISVESVQAQWIAEAGLWHAASVEEGLSIPVNFAGGTYSVAKSGDLYTSKSQRGNAGVTRVLTILSSQDSDDDDDAGKASPLDESKSSASAEKSGSSRIKLEFYSSSSKDAVLQSFEMSADQSSKLLSGFTFDKHTIWSNRKGKSLPTGTQKFGSSASRRTIKSKESEDVILSFKGKQKGSGSYTLILNFVDGSKSTLSFKVQW
ncbi:MAG: hypothetical protein HQ519_09595 [Planctomycetes bacterium]|nr:hypothetical protein [Planctomycetota bacterium]